ncbi:MAG: NADH:ubiquinone oxidoreductase [Bacteroidetes bacterium GWF2_33_16]|nr:MAG: NADH:ubiquinone oxidoreductase [Bacteroidetes bacterium GWE2_32_14]OFY08705.1 MAG: NADH:ubiquinone oxidoreductase [Bacteroidetes bacterium GWF2_33_16]
MLNNLKIMYHQGKQFIPNVTTVEVPGIFRGRPIISNVKINEDELVNICPLHAITKNPVSIDLGKCTFCGECAFAFPDKIKFTKDYKLATNERNGLIVVEGQDKPIDLNPKLIRKEIHKLFGGSLKLRQVSAAGDNSCEWELNAAGNVQFDMGRFGVEFVASPRHADGIVITGPISENMAEPLQICYDATPDPKIIILAGTDAISGGIFNGSSALNRSFLDNYKIDLFIAGNPVHPLSFINGILHLIKMRK